MLETLIPLLGRALDAVFDPDALGALHPHIALPRWQAYMPAWAVCVLALLVLTACTRVATQLAVVRGER